MSRERLDRLGKVTEEMDALVPQMLVVMQKEDMLAFLNECKKEFGYNPADVPDKDTAPALKAPPESKPATSPFVRLAKQLQLGQSVTAVFGQELAGKKTKQDENPMQARDAPGSSVKGAIVITDEVQDLVAKAKHVALKST